MSKLWTIGALLTWTTQFFTSKGIDSPRLDAEILLSHVLNKERIYLYAHYDEPMTTEELAAYRELVKKRADRLSVAHILGEKSFMGLDFLVNEQVLIPRPETEMLVETVLEQLPQDSEGHILDIGTGSGAILLSIIHERPQCRGLGVDISQQALEIARKNGERLGLSDRVSWQVSDRLASVPPAVYDWVVSNPPYLTADDMRHLQPEVRHDPALALFGGEDGLDYYRRIARDVVPYVKVHGFCAVEGGAGQSRDIASIFTETGHFALQQIVNDYGGIERVAVFQRKE